MRPYLPVLFGQIGVLEPLQVGEGLLRGDGGKVGARCVVLAHQAEGQIPFPQTLYRPPGIQAEEVSHGHQNP